MKLQRYKLVGCDKVADRCRAYMLSSGEGRYVDHSEALDWFESLLNGPSSECTGDAGFDMNCDGINAERARLRALIAADR